MRRQKCTFELTKMCEAAADAIIMRQKQAAAKRENSFMIFANTSGPKKNATVSELDAKSYIRIIDKKIASMVEARIGKTGAEEESLNVSIATLEMVRELVKAVFIGKNMRLFE